jgi:hypothetical protein
MPKNNNTDLLGYCVGALIAAVVIYNFWPFLLGGLAIFGFTYIFREFNKNKYHNRRD